MYAPRVGLERLGAPWAAARSGLSDLRMKYSLFMARLQMRRIRVAIARTLGRTQPGHFGEARDGEVQFSAAGARLGVVRIFPQMRAAVGQPVVGKTDFDRLHVGVDKIELETSTPVASAFRRSIGAGHDDGSARGRARSARRRPDKRPQA
jgi:hypothetical protein